MEYYGHVKVKGMGKILAPQFKAEWRAIKEAAREGLARRLGRPAETAAAAAVGGPVAAKSTFATTGGGMPVPARGTEREM